MSIEIANLFFEYEEAVTLYIETRNPALRLRAVVLRRQLLDSLLGADWMATVGIDQGFNQAPAWLAGAEEQ